MSIGSLTCRYSERSFLVHSLQRKPMSTRRPNEPRSYRQEETGPQKPRDDSAVDSGGRTGRQGCGDLPARGDQPLPVCAVAPESQGGHGRGPQANETQGKEQRPRADPNESRDRPSEGCSLRIDYRASALEKKRELGLSGSLRGKHLSRTLRGTLLGIIHDARQAGESLAAICSVLEVNPRAVYRWSQTPLDKPVRRGGGGINKITPKEEYRVVAHARTWQQRRCRRIAYDLERGKLINIGKTKVAEIMKAHGLNHLFVRGAKREKVVPAEMLLHEPWRKNLLWGMDWTWVQVGEKFEYLIVIIDWYSRMIVSWGLFPQVTSHEVVAVITDAVARQEIDLLPLGALKPRLVADHGSANTSQYTRNNIEVQGLDLWLSGIGRPTGNARTERVIGTLKWEEIDLQECYRDHSEARDRIEHIIGDYNYERPNSGNGGFAPAVVHAQGRGKLTKGRLAARQKTRNERITYWNQKGSDQTSDLS
jgi:transposase InsO family protein